MCKMFDFFHTDKKGKHLHLASGAVKDREILGGLVQRPVCSLSRLPCAKTASACRLDLSQFLPMNWHYNLVLQTQKVPGFRVLVEFRGNLTDVGEYKLFKFLFFSFFFFLSYFVIDCTVSPLTCSIVQEWTGWTKTLLLDKCKVRRTNADFMHRPNITTAQRNP